MVTKQQLREIHLLKREIDIDRRRLRAIEAASRTPQLDGLPHGGRGPGDPTGNTAALLCDLQRQIEAKCARCVALLLQLQQYIDGIADSEQRSVFYLKYVKQYSWTRIALELGYCDEQLPRKHHHRFLREQGIR